MMQTGRVAGLAMVLFGLAVLAGGVAAAPSAKSKPKGPFASTEAVLTWINRYREQPEPRRLPDAVRAMSALGLLRDMDQAGVYVGFTAGVLGANGTLARDLIARMFPLPPEEQALVIKAIAYSGLAEWKARLAEVVERMPARRVLIDRHLHGKGEVLETLALDTGPVAIDIMWGYYFATGATLPIKRMLAVLPWSADKKDLNRLTVGSMAKWTLASNAMRDKELLDLLREELPRQPAEVQAPLKDVIAAAQEFEVARIRKQALTAIEDLRHKGPAAERSLWATALNASPTVIGLACVAASVTGHVELGVPCIVSGALSTAAKNLWGGSATP